MKMIVMSVFDTAAVSFGRPWFLPSKGVGIRSFTDEVNRKDADNQLYQHPEDFILYELGLFDDAVGSFELLEKPVQVCRAADVAVRSAGAPVDLNQVRSRLSS